MTINLLYLNVITYISTKDMLAFVVRRGMGRRDIYNRRVCYLISCLTIALCFFIAGFIYLGISQKNQYPYYCWNCQYIYIACFIYGGIEAICGIIMFCCIINNSNTDTIVMNQNSPNLQRSYQNPYTQPQYPQQYQMNQYPPYPNQFNQYPPQQFNQYPPQQFNQYPPQQYRSNPKQAAKKTIPKQIQMDQPFLATDKVSFDRHQ